MVITWGSIILAVLKLINWILSTLKEEEWKQAGRDEMIAQYALAILNRTDHGKKIMEKVNAMSDQEVDDALAARDPK